MNITGLKRSLEQKRMVDEAIAGRIPRIDDRKSGIESNAAAKKAAEVFSNIGRGIKGAFKAGGQKLADAYRNSMSKFSENPTYTSLEILAALGGAIAAYIAGIPLVWAILIGVGVLILPALIRSKYFLSMVILLLVVWGLMMFWPLVKVYSAENKKEGTAAKTFGSISESLQRFNNQVKNYVDTQIQCASGNCPTGEAQDLIGISISKPQLLLPDKDYYVGDSVEVYADVEGENLRIYPDITVITNCSNGRITGKPTPEQIPFPDISSNKRTISCTLETIKTSSGINKLKFSIVFPFNTTSYLPVHLMDYSRRNALMQQYGRDFLLKYYKIDPEKKAVFNDGPINIGIKVNPTPMTINGPEGNSAELVFALTNQWGAFSGDAIGVSNIKVQLPLGLTLIPNKESCPFTGSGQTYVLDKDIIPPDYNITTVRSFVCGLKAENNINLGSTGYMRGFIVVSASYSYRLSSTYELNVLENDESGSTEDFGGLGVYTGPKIESSFDCTNKAESLPEYMKYYVKIYNSGPLSDLIKEGLDKAITRYKPDWLDEQQTRALLLAMMIKESSLGTNRDVLNAEGIPYHIAGCKCCAPAYDVVADIVCAAERIKSYVTDDSYCKEYVNAETQEKLRCAIKTYNNKNAADENYYIPVINYMYYWNSYFCGVQ
ncbi:MAG: hypothetical protein QXT20_02340 [Candidatus Woesearchaeota archaeon]